MNFKFKKNLIIIKANIKLFTKQFIKDDGNGKHCRN